MKDHQRRAKIGVSIARPLLEWAKKQAAQRSLTLSAYLTTVIDAERRRTMRGN